jgi:hypothetical protein
MRLRPIKETYLTKRYGLRPIKETYLTKIKVRADKRDLFDSEVRLRPIKETYLTKR